MALPAAAERWIRSACVSVDEPITTAPTALSASAASAVATCAPSCAASACAAAASTSITYRSLTPGWRTTLPAWILPIRPAPNTATSIIVISVLNAAS